MDISIDFGNDIEKMIRRLYKAEEDAFEKCVDIMRVLVEKLKAEAIKRVPVDLGGLEKSFSTKIIEAAAKDSVIGEVYIAANAMAADYALYMHEMQYELGPRSRDKQNASDVDVGRKYLERALDENQKAFGLYVYKKLKQYLGD
jgi:hypothetical protein